MLGFLLVSWMVPEADIAKLVLEDAVSYAPYIRPRAHTVEHRTQNPPGSAAGLGQSAKHEHGRKA